MEFEGEFETHVTVRGDDPSQVDRLGAWAARRGLTFHHIVLDRGATTSQPMVTRRGRGRLSDERAAASELRGRLVSDGFAVTRIKIEAAPWNADVPDSDDRGLHHPGRYFEHHVKLTLAPDADLRPLVELARRHAAHLSRNARRIRSDGRQERFVTQRCHDVGRPSARERLGALVAELEANRYPILDVEEEFVVLDSEPGVDAGWLDPAG